MNFNNINDTSSSGNSIAGSAQKFESLFGIRSNLIVNSEIYTMMKENSLFLLELSSTGSGGILGQQKRSPQQMPVVSETQLHQIAADLNKPSTSRAESSPLGKGISKTRPTTSTPNRRSEVPASGICVSPELLWQAPDSFSCLESLGATIAGEQPYSAFGMNTAAENGFERVFPNIVIFQ